MHSSVLDIGWWWVHSSLTHPLPSPSKGFSSAHGEKIGSMPCHLLLLCWGSFPAGTVSLGLGTGLALGKWRLSVKRDTFSYPRSRNFTAWCYFYVGQNLSDAGNRTFNSDWIYCLFHLTTHGCVVLASGEAWIRTRSAGQHLSLGQGPLGLAAALCWLQSTASTLSLTNSAPLAQKMRREAAWGTEAVALSLARDLSDYALWMG